jgi:hypothetical protein
MTLSGFTPSMRGRIMTAPNRDAGLADYESLKPEIARRYAPGRFVAIESGQVVADADSHRALVQKLQSLGKSPQGMIIVQAGVDYPEHAVIFHPAARARDPDV